MGACCLYWICLLGKRPLLRMSPRSLRGHVEIPAFTQPCSHENPGVQFIRHLREALSGAVNGALREGIRENEPKWTMVVPSPTQIWLKIAKSAGNDLKPNLKVEF